MYVYMCLRAFACGCVCVYVCVCVCSHRLANVGMSVDVMRMCNVTYAYLFLDLCPRQSVEAEILFLKYHTSSELNYKSSETLYHLLPNTVIVIIVSMT